MSPRVIPSDAVPDAPVAGGKRARLVDAETGVDAMTLDRITLAPDAEGPELQHRGAERFLYVIRGSGTAGELRLEPEMMIWLEPGDRLRLVAAADGLQVLVAEARG